MRYEHAPEAVRPTLRLLRSIRVPYTPWEVVVEMAAELAPEVPRGWAAETERGPGRPARGPHAPDRSSSARRGAPRRGGAALVGTCGMGT